MNKLCMPIDKLAKMAAGGIAPITVIDRNNLSTTSTGSKETDAGYGKKLEEFEALVILVRSMTEPFRGKNATSSEFVDFLVDRFKDKQLASEDWVYDIIHPTLGLQVVCQRAWLGVFGVTMNQLKHVQEKVRENSSTAPALKETVTKKAAFAAFGMDVNHYHRYLTALMDYDGIPTDKARYYIAAAHLANWIDSSGEWQPDKEEIHLDFTTFKAIYDEYVRSQPVLKMMEFNGKLLSYNEFRSMCQKTFPKVHIRKSKGITGKCHFCEGLANLTRTCHLVTDLILIRNYRMYHRNFFMGEKIAYYNRQMMAFGSEGLIWSIIVDGWSKHKSQVCIKPFHTNTTSVSSPPIPH